MAKVNDFLEWLEEDFWFGISTKKMQLVEDGFEEDTGARRVRLNLYTHNHRYAIAVINPRVKSKSYLGCIVYCRASYAGEDHIRSSDLADGELTKATWNEIKNDIIRHELVNMGSAQFNPLRP